MSSSSSLNIASPAGTNLPFVCKFGPVNEQLHVSEAENIVSNI